MGSVNVLSILLGTLLTASVGFIIWLVQRLITKGDIRLESEKLENQKRSQVERESFLRLIEDLNRRILDHERDCNLIPKGVILAKVDSLCDKTDIYQKQTEVMVAELKLDMREQKDDLHKYIAAVDKSYHDFKNLITVHLLSQGLKSSELQQQKP